MRLITLFTKDLESMTPSFRVDLEYGFSVYRDTLVVWDERHDERILEVLDNLPEDHLDKLLVVNYHKGTISFIWEGPAPPGYDPGYEGVDTPDGDWWVVHSSESLYTDD